MAAPAKRPQPHHRSCMVVRAIYQTAPIRDSACSHASYAMMLCGYPCSDTHGDPRNLTVCGSLFHLDIPSTTPSRYATAPASGGGKRWHSPYAAALRALQLRMCYARPFCCSPVSSTSPTNSSAVCLTAQRQRGGQGQQSPPRRAESDQPRVTKALAIPSSWMSVVVMSQKHSMP